MNIIEKMRANPDRGTPCRWCETTAKDCETGYGHNPEPLGNRTTDRCCMVCNDTKVIPERMRRAGIKW
jgi:hypothetical protein